MKYLLLLLFTSLSIACNKSSTNEEPPEIKIVTNMYHDTYGKTTKEDKRYQADLSTCIAEIHASTGAPKVDQTDGTLVDCLSNLGWVTGELIHLNAKTGEIIKTIEMK